MHGELDAVTPRRRERRGIPGVRVTRDADSRIVREHALESPSGAGRAVGDAHLTGVQRVPDPHTPAVVERDPCRPGGSVQERVQDRPVGDGIRAVRHALGLAERRRDRAGVEVVAPDDHRCADVPALHEVVQGAPEPGALALPQPADARGEALKRDALLREPDPAPDVLVLGEQLEDEAIGAVQVLRLARERHPPEWPLALAEEWSDVLRHEARNRERVRHAGVAGRRANVVAVVERHRTTALELEQRLHMGGDAGDRAAQVVLRVAPPELGGLRYRQRRWDVAVQRVVRRGLVRDDVGREPPARELRQHGRAIPHESDRKRGTIASRLVTPAQRLLDRAGGPVQVAGGEPPLDPRGIDLNRETDPLIHGGGEWLRPAHAAEPAREDDPPAQRAAEVSPCHGAERLVGALEDALSPDVNPRARGHLPEHDQTAPLELVEHLPGSPATDQVGVGDQHARRVGMGGEHAHRLARLHEQRLLVAQSCQSAADCVERCPIPRRFSCPPVHDEVLRALGYVGIEVVHQHAQRGFLNPAAARLLRSPRRAHGASAGHGIPTLKGGLAWENRCVTPLPLLDRTLPPGSPPPPARCLR